MILIVDDDVKLADSLERLFRYSGHDAVAVNHGMEALALLQLRAPTLVILDLGLDAMSGLTLLTEVRQRFAEVPVVIHTADVAQASEAAARAAGAQDYIIKGTTGSETLVRRVEALLPSHRVEKAAHTLEEKTSHRHDELKVAATGETA